MSPIAVAQTLENAHNLEVAIDGKDFHGIVHGDIKPKNIRIDARGEVRVLDFGIAKALSLSRRLTRNEFGSVPYASPERLDIGRRRTSALDLWSLAVMLYEMVAGVQPYPRPGTERLERMIRSRMPRRPRPSPAPSRCAASWSRRWRPTRMRATQRPREFADDLEAFREGAPVAAG